MKEFAVYLLAGEFGLLTLTPIFLFTTLLPAVTAFGLISQILEKTGFASPLLLSFIMGFGCTSAALSTINDQDNKLRFAASVILCQIVPCSAQVAVIVPLLFYLDLLYVFFYFASLLVILTVLYKILILVCIGKPLVLVHPPQKQVFPKVRILFMDAFVQGLKFIKDAFFPFVIGSIVVSCLSWFGFFTWLCRVCSPFTYGFLRLPQEATSLFILSILKRDLGAAGLLSIIREGSFSMAELTVTLLILTLFAPCFASTVILIKKEGLLIALLIWILTLSVAFAAGKIASIILL